jgi:flavin-binding protein dodecin
VPPGDLERNDSLSPLPGKSREPEAHGARSVWRPGTVKRGREPQLGRNAQGRHTMPTAEKDHVYKLLELVGSSETSIEDAIKNAVSRAAKTVREMKWFEVVQTRGHIENGAVGHYQVTLRVGFTLDE